MVDYLTRIVKIKDLNSFLLFSLFFVTEEEEEERETTVEALM